MCVEWPPAPLHHRGSKPFNEEDGPVPRTVGNFHDQVYVGVKVSILGSQIGAKVLHICSVCGRYILAEK
jgi:hypothetical protein